MRRFYENWPDLKNILHNNRMNFQKESEKNIKKIKDVIQSITDTAVGRYEMIRNAFTGMKRP